jgi:hypothetical protein
MQLPQSITEKVNQLNYGSFNAIKDRLHKPPCKGEIGANKRKA